MRDKSGNLLAVAPKIRRRLFVGVRVFHTHLVCHLESCSNLDEFALTDTGAPGGGFLPGTAVFDEFGPEGKETALDGFDGVDAAAACIEKGALLRFATGLANAAHVTGAVNVEGFEIGLSEAEKTGGARDIVFGEVDVAGDLAAFAAAGLAGEANFEIGGAAHATPA